MNETCKTLNIKRYQILCLDILCNSPFESSYIKTNHTDVNADPFTAEIEMKIEIVLNKAFE